MLHRLRKERLLSKKQVNVRAFEVSAQSRLHGCPSIFFLHNHRGSAGEPDSPSGSFVQLRKSTKDTAAARSKGSFTCYVQRHYGPNKNQFQTSGVAYRQQILLETMGGGIAMFDYDNDGRMDLFFTNGAAIKDS